MMMPKTIENLLADAVAIEEEEAREAGMIGYMARAMVQATLPHSRPAINEFTRKNGNFTLTMLCPSKIGLPYGSIPRLLLAWITTEAVKTQDKTLILGNTLADFMRELELGEGTGGKTGSITRLRNQMRKLFSSTISCDYHDNKRDAGAGFRIATSYETWWTPQAPDQAGLWQSNVTLDEAFYKEIITSPVPVDLRALKALRRSPLALDLYNWLTYRNSYLKKDTLMRWESLAMQLGSAYSRTRDFKAALLTELKKVQVVYPEAKIGIDEAGLILKPSPTHILR
ncbi:MAG: replication protein RepA [Geobacter sp.]